MWIQLNKKKGVQVHSKVVAVTIRKPKVIKVAAPGMRNVLTWPEPIQVIDTEQGALVADDGTVCSTKEEMLEINKKVECAFLREKLWNAFGQFQYTEKSDWFRVNILRETRGSLCEIAKLRFRHLRVKNVEKT